jgi:parvulin-like peptidyl-prolyl isomerase
MIGAFRQWFARPTWRRAGLFMAGAAFLAAGVWFGRGMLVHRATAQPTPAPAEVAPSETTSDYTTRVVAYLHGSQTITRQELGEYLLVRYGYDKLPLLLNKRIVDDACRERGIELTAADIEAAFAEDLKGLAMEREKFIQTVLTRYKKTLYEWKEDMLRPRVQMTRLASPRISVSQEDLRRAYESAYGEKVECRLIMWPLSKEKEALEQYGKLRSSEEEFDKAARAQDFQSWLAASAGKIKPVGRWAMAEELEKEVFRLQPGQVSTLVKTPQGIHLIKCDKRLPADTAVSFESVKPQLEVQIRQAKLQVEVGGVFQALKEKSQAQVVLKRQDRAAAGPMPSPTQVVAYLHGAKPVTREELGEFLISRYGPEKLEFLMNRRIIDRECEARKIAVSDEEVEKAFDDDLKSMKVDDKKKFEKEFLAKWDKNIFEWREDVIRPRLMLTRLCQDKVKVLDEDLKKAFESYYGERMECRVILYPPDQAKFAMSEYGTIRDSEAAFAEKAKKQPSGTLAANGGKLEAFGRHALGDENLEREVFKLKEGEVSTLIGTPQGQVVVKCDKRIPPDTKVKLEDVRERLTKEIRDKKVQIEMQVAFGVLRKQANPQFILKNTAKPEDLLAESKKLMEGLPPVVPPMPK